MGLLSRNVALTTFIAAATVFFSSVKKNSHVNAFDIVVGPHRNAGTSAGPFSRRRKFTIRPFYSMSSSLNMATTTMTSYTSSSDTTPTKKPNSKQYIIPNEITSDNPLRVIIAGAGVGGLALANALTKHGNNIDVIVLERTDEFKRFGGPIQLASNALQVLKTMDEVVFDQIMDKFTFTGDKMNGIKDGIRDEWYAKFDLRSPAECRNMPYTGVIERPELQDIYLGSLPKGVVRNGDAVVRYETNNNSDDGYYGLNVYMESGDIIYGDVLIGADGIWSAVRATMRDEPARGDGSGVTYSGYTVYAGELDYDSFDNGQVGYKVYIGPGQYFVITDIGNGRYQWYAFLARKPGSAETEDKPFGSVRYLKDIFKGWSKDVHHILDATQEHEVEQRDLYDRPPSVMKPWTCGPVALLGDSVHAMMPNLGQGGCQAIEDAYVLVDELKSVTTRDSVEKKLKKYYSRRLIRSAAVQGLSRFASDIIILGFDTPAKIWFDKTKKGNGSTIRFENFNYAGIVTKMLQPILPLFFNIQFNFLYDGWKNEMAVDVSAGLGLLLIGGLILIIAAGSVGEASIGLGLGLDALIGGEGFEAFLAGLREMIYR